MLMLGVLVRLFGCGRHRRRRRRRRSGMLVVVLVFVRGMNVFRLRRRLQVLARLYADKNISPHPAFRVAANRAEIFIGAVLACLDDDLFGLKYLSLGAAGKFCSS